MMLTADFSEGVSPEDREIIEKLAKLQNMSSQIGGLRSLLPEKLINPARVALDNPGQYEPEKLATYLQTAAKAGSRDVETFKKDWHSDDVRALLHNVNAKGLPQGGDAWPLDYGGFLQDVATNDQTPTTPNGASHEFQPPTNAELVKAVDDFRARHPELDIHVSDGATLLPIDIQVAHFDLRVERASNGGTGYIVIDKPGRAASGLRHDILQSISESKERAHLATVLEMISSYQDVKTRPCQRCNKLFDSKTLQLPLVRQPSASQGDQDLLFLALHRDCR